MKKSYPEVLRQERSIRIVSSLNSPLLRAKLLFLKAVLPSLQKFEKPFQSEAIMVHKLHDEMALLLKEMLSMFVMTDNLKAANTIKS